MSWVVKHIDDRGVISNEAPVLTDEELVDLYMLVNYGSAPSHKKIAHKLEGQAKTAQDNILQKHRWEDEGGSYEKSTQN